MAHRFAFAAVSAALLLAPLRASAQDVAAAEALFNKGVADMGAGRFETACPALAESHRLDPRPGTLFTEAECFAKAGKIATAVALYEDYQRSVSSQAPAVKAKHADRVRIARGQVDKLRPVIPMLTLVTPPSLPRDARVRRDGTELSAAALGIALPVDPGAHVVTVDAPGLRTWEQKFTLDRAQKKTIELSLGGAAGAGPTATVVTSPAAAEGDKPSPGQGQRVAGFVVGGVGAAALVMGAVTGGLTLAKKSTISDNCVDTKCNHEGKLAADSAKTTGLVSTIGFGVGLAGLATGMIVLLTAPKKAEEKPVAMGESPRLLARPVQLSVVQMGPDGISIGVKGVW